MVAVEMSFLSFFLQRSFGKRTEGRTDLDEERERTFPFTEARRPELRRDFEILRHWDNVSPPVSGSLDRVVMC
jgi:hypothetical protein